MKVRRRFEKGIEVSPTDLGVEDLTREGEVAYDSSDDKLKYRNASDTKELVNTDETQTLENKTIDGTAATGNNTVTTDADQISYDNSTSSLTATDAQAAIDEVEGRLDTVETAASDSQTDIDNHIADSVDAHDASAISNVPSGNLAATDVQTALDELQTDIDTRALDADLTNHINDAADAHDASAISYDNATSGLTATDAQAALDEIEGRIDTIEGATYVNSFNTRTGDVTPAASDYDADQVDYDNATSGLIATDVQAAIDEVEGRVDNSDAHIAASSDVHGIGVGNDVVGTGTQQDITNKDIDGGTASNDNRITIPKNTKANLDALTRKEATIVYATDDQSAYIDNGTDLIPIGSGSGFGINYVENSDLELNADGYNTYADASQEVAEDGTGGSPTLTAVRSTSTPLRETASLLITKDAADRQGEGVSYDFTVDNADTAKKLTISFDYDASSTGYADGDIRIYVYDVTNGSIIRVSNEDLKGGKGTHYSQFQTAADSTSYRLILHVATTNASAYAVKVDNVQVGPRLLNGMADSRVIVEGEDNGGTSITASSTNIDFTETVDTTSSWNGSEFTAPETSTYKVEGSVTFTANAVRNVYLWVDTGSGYAQTRFISSSAGSNTTTFPFNGEIRLNKGDKIAIRVNSNGGTLGGTSQTHWINIQKNERSGIISSDLGGREVFVEGRGNGGEVITVTTENIPFTETQDTTASFDGIVFTAPKTAKYEFEGATSWTTGAARTLYAYIDTGGGFTQDKFIGTNNGVSTDAQGFKGTLPLNKGDMVAIRSLTNAGTLNNDTNVHWITVKEVTTSQQILETETVGARYTSNAGQAIGTSTTDIVYEDLVKDTHNAYNPSTGVFTVPVTGDYAISAKLTTATVTLATTQSLELSIEVDGTEIDESLTRGLGLNVPYPVQVETTFLPLTKGQEVIIVARSGTATTMNTTAKLNVLSISRIK